MKTNTTKYVNSLWPSDAIWWQSSGSTLVQVRACCLTAPSHQLNQCWLLIRQVQWHSLGSNFTVSAQTSILYNEFENYSFAIIATSRRGQWVKLEELSYFSLHKYKNFHSWKWIWKWHLQNSRALYFVSKSLTLCGLVTWYWDIDLG